jgi:hypothetical protein
MVQHVDIQHTSSKPKRQGADDTENEVTNSSGLGVRGAWAVDDAHI